MTHLAPETRAGSIGRFVAYAAMIVGTVLLFLLIRQYGETLVAAHAVAEHVAESKPPVYTNDALVHVLIVLAAVIALGNLLGAAFRKLGQPPVIGEVIAGIMLGPSCLGWLAPTAAAYILPPSVAPSLGVVAQLGVILYMFCIGLELNIDQLRERGHAILSISHASIIAPFVLGSLLAIWLFPRYAIPPATFTGFSLFLGVAMSVTAFPVLARILSDRGISKTPLGSMALACAAIDDVTAWCLLAFMVSVAQADMGDGFRVIALTLGYIGVMFLVGRPLIKKWTDRYEASSVSRGVMAIMFIGLLGSALMTELIGIHAIFGAFMFGAIIPHDSRIVRELTAKMEDVVTVLLLPAFFALTGLRTQIGLIAGWENWFWCAIIIVVATLGKFGGTLAAARLTGIGWRDASSLGVLMNTRGLMGLIVLNIGLDLNLISPLVFAMMVIMAIVTTIATTPILQTINRPRG